MLVRRALWRWLALLAVIAVTAVSAFCWRPNQTLPPHASDSSQPKTMPIPVRDRGDLKDFVGSAACRSCHAAICDEYQTHPMSRSLLPIADVTPLEDWSKSAGFVAADGRKYHVEHTNSAYQHHESLSDAQGEILYDQHIAIDFAVGSGQRGRTYLYQASGSILQSSMTWYSSERRWNLSPGYDAHSHQRFSRRVSTECLVCHSGRVAVMPDREDQFEAMPFFEHSIGCERCHGPGKPHITWHRTEERTGFDPIVNPAQLDPIRREAVCNQCHLQGEHRVTRLGMRADDFRPGMHLSDVWTSFLKTSEVAADNSVLAVSQVEQMQSSRCFLESDGKLGCTSCHSPHRIPMSSEKEAYYRDRCVKCHAPDNRPCAISESERQQRTNNSCINCHMPRLPASDVPHTSQTDHRILKRPKPDVSNTLEVQLPRPRVSQGQVELREYIDNPQGIGVLELQRAQGIFLSKRASGVQNAAIATRAMKLLSPALAVYPEDVASLFASAQAAQVLNQGNLARKQLERLIQIAPQHEYALEMLAIMHHDGTRPELAAPYYEKLIHLNPSRPEYHGRYAHVLGMRGDFNRAQAEANRALELNPTLLQTHLWLSQVYAQQGNAAMSTKHSDLVARFRQIQRDRAKERDNPAAKELNQ